MTGADRRTAAMIVEQALSAVFDPAVVSQLREDSPLATVGMVPADAVSIADAVSAAAAARGLTCELSDHDFEDATTVADLVQAVEAASGSDSG